MFEDEGEEGRRRSMDLVEVRTALEEGGGDGVTTALLHPVE